MKVLVTGATGFLGGALVRRLVQQGIDVVATGRNERALAALPLAAPLRFAWDLAHPYDGDAASGITAVVHCAALSSAWGRQQDFREGNVEGTRHALALAARLGAEHFVQISTPAVYFRFEDQIDVPEDMPLPPPVNDYAATKAEADALVEASGLPATILRPRGIYGRGDTALLPRLLKAARSGPLPRFRGGAARTDITHVDDVVDAIGAALQVGPTAQCRTFNISGGEALPIATVVERACAATGTAVRWRDLPVGPTLAAVRLNEWLHRLRRGAEPKITAYGLGIFAFTQTLDISRARDELGWAPQVPFAEGLARTFAPLERSARD